MQAIRTFNEDCLAHLDHLGLYRFRYHCGYCAGVGNGRYWFRGIPKFGCCSSRCSWWARFRSKNDSTSIESNPGAIGSIARLDTCHKSNGSSLPNWRSIRVRSTFPVSVSDASAYPKTSSMPELSSDGARLRKASRLHRACLKSRMLKSG